MISDRIDNITKIPDEYRHAKLPAPRSVKIELSPRCNYRCGFCALRTRKKQPTKDMDFDLFRKIASECKDAGVEEIGVFYLGESFMDPQLLVEAIQFAKDIGIPYVFLTTNGSRATPTWVHKCMLAGLDSLKFSVNAADEEQFVQVMGVKAKFFEQSLRNIGLAWGVRESMDTKCGLYASSIKYDGEQQAKMEKLIEERVRPYVDEHYWLPLYSMGAIATAREEELGYRPTAGNQGRLGALRDPLPCWSAFTEGHVRADGGLSLCCFDSDGRFQMGDLKTQTFMESWNSQAFQDIRAAHLNKRIEGTVCEDCVAY